MTEARRTRVEVCIDSPDGALAARDGGADRLEVCADLGAGGLTPSPGLLAWTRENVELELAVTQAQPPQPVVDDALEGSGNDTRDEATTLTRGRHENLRVAGNDDWYALELQPGEELSFDVDFVHADGDIDVELVDAAGNRLADSAGTGDRETVTYLNSGGQPTTVYLRVYGYDGASNGYSLTTR